MPARQRLSREVWAIAGLQALTAGGVAAIAIEPLATTLGTTKGSFYWHFSDREDFVRAVLDLWEQEQTSAVIDRLDAVKDPTKRLRALLTLVLTSQEGPDPVAQLFRDIAHPEVAAAVRRVTSRRIDFVADELHERGMPEGEARSRAAVAVAAYIGWWQLNAVLPEDAPVGPDGRQHAKVLWLICEAALS
ncbi:MAG: TetR/AcrR family transcriptional regulator [Aquihabitans sp.]